jgi:hypothetical protein
VVAVNKIDILETPDDVARVVGFVKEKAHALLGIRPQVFPVSARQARRGKAESNEALLRASGFDALEGFVTRALRDTVRVRLKLLNPLGVGQRVLEEAERAAQEQLAGLGADLSTLERVEELLKRHREDLGRDARARVADVEKGILEVYQRGAEVLARKLRIAGVVDLIASEATGAEIERKVVGDLSRVVERRVDEAVAALASREDAQGKQIAQLLASRTALHADRLDGGAVGGLGDGRAWPSSDLRREAQRVLETHDLQSQAQRIALLARHAALAAALSQLAAVLFAGAVFALAATTASQVAGILAGAALSLVGVMLVPLARARAGDRLGKTVGALREALASRLKASFDRELDHGRDRILEAIGPYSRFVRSEGDRLRAQREEIAELRSRLETVSALIESTRGPEARA